MRVRVFHVVGFEYVRFKFHFAFLSGKKCIWTIFAGILADSYR